MAESDEAWLRMPEPDGVEFARTPAALHRWAASHPAPDAPLVPTVESCPLVVPVSPRALVAEAERAGSLGTSVRRVPTRQLETATIAELLPTSLR